MHSLCSIAYVRGLWCGLVCNFQNDFSELGIKIRPPELGHMILILSWINYITAVDHSVSRLGYFVFTILSSNLEIDFGSKNVTHQSYAFVMKKW